MKFEKKLIDKKIIFDFYLENILHINNWDLVDSSSYKILGKILFERKNKKILFDLSKSNNIWKRRISIVSTLYFIKNNQFDTTIKLSEKMLNDKEDLIHKAVGWMLREVGNKDKSLLINFLNKYKLKMPRVMLRYSIEKFNFEDRKEFLKTNFQ